jgi:hypothetical protein
MQPDIKVVNKARSLLGLSPRTKWGPNQYDAEIYDELSKINFKPLFSLFEYDAFECFQRFINFRSQFSGKMKAIGPEIELSFDENDDFDIDVSGDIKDLDIEDRSGSAN